MNPFDQKSYMGELDPWTLMLMVDSNGRTIRMTRKNREIEVEISFNMVDSNSNLKGDQYSFFQHTSFQFRIPDPVARSPYFDKAEIGLGMRREATTLWLEREDPFVKELWMPMLPNWLNAVKMAKERCDGEWQLAEYKYNHMVEQAEAELRWQADLRGEEDADPEAK